MGFSSIPQSVTNTKSHPGAQTRNPRVALMLSQGTWRPVELTSSTALKSNPLSFRAWDPQYSQTAPLLPPDSPSPCSLSRRTSVFLLKDCPWISNYRHTSILLKQKSLVPSPHLILHTLAPPRGSCLPEMLGTGADAHLCTCLFLSLPGCPSWSLSLEPTPSFSMHLPSPTCQRLQVLESVGTRGQQKQSL